MTEKATDSSIMKTSVVRFAQTFTEPRIGIYDLTGILSFLILSTATILGFSTSNGIAATIATSADHSLPNPAADSLPGKPHLRRYHQRPASLVRFGTNSVL